MTIAFAIGFAAGLIVPALLVISTLPGGRREQYLERDHRIA